MSTTVPTFADDQLAALMSRPPAAFGELDVEAVRRGIAERAAGRPRGPELHAVSELRIGGVPARLFRPAAGPLPLVLHLHGGGWSVGTVASFDRACRRLAARSGAAVLSLDYRLAPEDRWPASVDDTVAALREIATGPEALGPLTGRTAVVGDSAGGTLATLACLRLRHEDPDALPDLQALVYAAFDLTGAQWSADVPGGLDAETERFFIAQWVPDPGRRSDPRVSPHFAEDLTGLPPALVVTAEHDPLRDEAEAFGARLRAAGVPVAVRRELGLVHNFLQLDEQSPACAAAGDRLADDLARALA